MHSESVRTLWIVIITLGGLLGGLVCGLLFRLAGADLPASLGAGGTAFLGLVSVGLAAVQVFRN